MAFVDDETEAAPAVDPVADFLAREQDQLAELDENFGEWA